MSKVLTEQNQVRVWNALGYEGEPASEITMLDVYEWEGEFLMMEAEIKDKLKDLQLAVEENALPSEEENELYETNDDLGKRRATLREILLAEGYPNGLYFAEAA